MSRTVVIVFLSLLLGSAHPVTGAQLIVNGAFDSDLGGWLTTGGVSHAGDFALIAESPPNVVNAIFQTVGAMGPDMILSFDLLTAGMSQTVPGGALPDTAFGTVYFGDLPFGSDPTAGLFNESLALFDLDRNGVALLSGAITLSPLAARPGWVRMTIPIHTNRDFITFVIEEYNLNLTAGDSIVGLDEVTINVVPEPASLALLLLVLARCLLVRAPPT